MADGSHTIRKSSFGRTQLFLPEANVTLREVKCMGGIQRRDGASVYHTLPNVTSVPNVACWHCCETITDPSTCVPIPRVHDAVRDAYHVYGCTCSPGCAKAYVLEHTTFDRGQHLNTLVRMLREVYGIIGPVVETPPRPALKRFGGLFDPSCLPRTVCHLVEPPFVSYCMIVDEHSTPTDVVVREAESVAEEHDTLEEPMPPPLFNDFLRKAATSPPHVARRTEEEERPKRPRVGPMSRYCKS
jgi:hypothetical protein